MKNKESEKYPIPREEILIPKVSWKTRFKRKSFWTALIGLILLLCQQMGFHIPDNLSDVVNTILTLAVLIGIINDPTTDGFSDRQHNNFDMNMKG